jgi:hypothetical protein
VFASISVTTVGGAGVADSFFVNHSMAAEEEAAAVSHRLQQRLWMRRRWTINY